MKAIKEFLTYTSARDFALENYLAAIKNMNLDGAALSKVMLAQNRPLYPGHDNIFITEVDRVWSDLPGCQEDLVLYFYRDSDMRAKYISVTMLHDVAEEYGGAVQIIARAGAKMLPFFALNHPNCGDPEASILLNTENLAYTKEQGWIYSS